MTWFRASLGSIAIIGLGLFSSCSQKYVETQRAKDVDTRLYRTYRWISQDDSKYLGLRHPNTNQPVLAWVNIRQKPDTEARVRAVVEKDLRKGGYLPKDEGLPDFFVTYYSPARDLDWLSSWTGMTLAFQGAPLVIFPDFDMKKALGYRQGMAYIVIYDSRTKRPAWTGTIIDAISPTGQVNTPVVTGRLNELLADFKNKA